MRLDVARGQSTRIQREDLVVKPLKAPLTLLDDLRIKTAVAIARRVDPHASVLSDQRLGTRAVARVPRAARRLGMRLIAHMVSQLDLHRALHQPLGQLRQKAARSGDLLLRASAGQQLIDHLVGDPLTVASLDHRPQSGAIDGVIHQPLTDL